MRAQGIGGKETEDIGQQQFLMLLLMLDTQFQKPRDLPHLRAARGEEFAQGRIHMGAIGEDLLRRGTSQYAARSSRMPRPLRGMFSS